MLKPLIGEAIETKALAKSEIIQLEVISALAWVCRFCFLGGPHTPPLHRQPVLFLSLLPPSPVNGCQGKAWGCLLPPLTNPSSTPKLDELQRAAFMTGHFCWVILEQPEVRWLLVSAHKAAGSKNAAEGSLLHMRAWLSPSLGFCEQGGTSWLGMTCGEPAGDQREVWIVSRHALSPCVGPGLRGLAPGMPSLPAFLVSCPSQPQMHVGWRVPQERLIKPSSEFIWFADSAKSSF